MTMTTDFPGGLPDPVEHAEFYDGVPTKRTIAWGIDVTLIAMASLALGAVTVVGLFVLPLLYLCVGFAYRLLTVANGSATWGMRLTGIELCAADGRPLDAPTAFLHVTGHTVAVVAFPLVLVSAVMIGITARRQGLTDLVLGTTAIRRGH